MRNHLIGQVAGIAAGLAAAAASRADVVLDSASRSVQGGVAFAGFGAFSDSQSGTGFASPNGTGAWSAMQTSNIDVTGVTYAATYGAAIQSGGPQVEFAGGSVGFTFAFDITNSAQMISYHWQGYFLNAPILTGPGATPTSLDTNGATMAMLLGVGHYSFSASDYVQTFAQGLPAYTEHAVGSISFVPAPGALGLLGLGGLATGRRRR